MSAYNNTASQAYAAHRQEIESGEHTRFDNVDNTLPYFPYYDVTRKWNPDGMNMNFGEGSSEGWETVRDWGGKFLSKYIFESRVETLDMTGLFQDATMDRPKEGSSDVRFFIPLDAYGAYNIFKNFGSDQLVEGMREVRGNRVVYTKYKNGPACNDFSTLAQIRDEMCKYVKYYMGLLSSYSRSEKDDKNYRETLYDTIGGVQIGDIRIKRWDTLVDRFGGILMNYFGPSVNPSNERFITTSSIENTLTSNRLMSLFPISHGQLYHDAHLWKTRFWKRRQDTPFDELECKSISVSYPFEYVAPKEYVDIGLSVPFKGVIEFHYSPLYDASNGYGSVLKTHHHPHSNHHPNHHHSNLPKIVMSEGGTPIQINKSKRSVYSSTNRDKRLPTSRSLCTYKSKDKPTSTSKSHNKIKPIFNDSDPLAFLDCLF